MVTPFGRAEGDHILPGRAAHQRWRAIISITKIVRTGILEHHGVNTCFALVRRPILVPTTENIKIECQACTLACHHLTMYILHLQLLWAYSIDIL